MWRSAWQDMYNDMHFQTRTSTRYFYKSAFRFKETTTIDKSCMSFLPPARIETMAIDFAIHNQVYITWLRNSHRNICDQNMSTNNLKPCQNHKSQPKNIHARVCTLRVCLVLVSVWRPSRFPTRTKTLRSHRIDATNNIGSTINLRIC